MPFRVAIVDDNATVRGLIRSFIESHTDWLVSGEAEDGDSAISLAERLTPDFVVLDFSMPVKNGLDAARTIARICPSSVMVLFTAHVTEQLVMEAQRAGVRAVIPKDGKDSLEQLVTVLGAASQVRRTA